MVGTDRLWPVKVEPLDDELFSSWLERTALEYLSAPHSFARIVFGDRAVWNRDIDKSGTFEMASALARPMDVDPDVAVRTLLRSFEGALVEKHNANGNSRWIMPLGVWHRRRRLGGLQFCPLCLASDPVPYFRKCWRLSFVSVCHEHQVYLSDHCDQCGSAVHFHCLVPTAGSLRRCPFCGFDLARTRTFAAPATRSRDLQRVLLEAAYSGWAKHEAFGCCRSLLAFPVLARLAALLLSGRRIAKRFQRTAFLTANVDPISAPARVDFDRLGAIPRFGIIEVIATLIEDWPKNFAEVCERSGAGVSILLDEYHQLPFWYERVVRERFDRQPYRETLGEFLAALDYLERSGLSPTPTTFRGLFGKDDILRKRKEWTSIVNQRFH